MSRIASTGEPAALRHRLELIRAFTDPTFDPFVETYGPHLERLNAIVRSTGAPLEGGVFYKNLETDLSALSPGYLNKRRGLALAALQFSSVQEIGFNAGHSALLLLSANPSLRLTSIDICRHKYTMPCFHYLKSVFGDRIDLIEANSLVAFPILKRAGRDCDLFIIDGGHGVDVAEVDLYNVLQFGKRGSIILFDDSDMPELRVLLDMYLITGELISISDQLGLLKNTNQMFFINNRKA